MVAERGSSGDSSRPNMAAMTEAVKTAFVGISEGVKNSPMEDEVKGALQATIGQLFVMVDMVAGILANLSVIGSEKVRMEEDIKGVVHTSGMVQGAVETLIKQQESKSGGGGHYRRNNILECKSVTNLKMIGADKSGFRAWHERLVNVMEQIRPGSRGIFKALARHVDHEVTEEFAEWIKGQQEYADLKDEDVFKEVNEDVYVLLMDKAESEALTRVRAYQAGDGLNAYRSVYKWFMGVSGQAIADKMRKLMAPSTPKAEHDIADQLDKWIESVRTLENLKPEFFFF